MRLNVDGDGCKYTRTVLIENQNQNDFSCSYIHHNKNNYFLWCTLLYFLYDLHHYNDDDLILSHIDNKVLS